MKIAGIEMPHVKQDLLSKVEFECALAVEDWHNRMMQFGISVPQNLQYTLFEIMCTAAEKTVMGNYDEGNYKSKKDKGDEAEEPCR
jgi:hypothetical protein